MSPTPATLDRAGHDAAAQQRDEDAQYYRAVLHELIEMGAGLARAVHNQATAAPPAAPQPGPDAAPSAAPPAPADLAVAFDRIARTIRRTVALARKLAEPASLGTAGRDAEAARQRRLAARKQVIREVEDTIQRRDRGRAETEALHAEFRERLDSLDLDDDLEHQPVAEVIQAICRDLGIAVPFPGTRPWKRRTPQDVRDLAARAAQRPPAARPAGAGTTGRPEARPTTTGGNPPRTAFAPPPTRIGTTTGPPAP